MRGDLNPISMVPPQILPSTLLPRGAQVAPTAASQFSKGSSPPSSQLAIGHLRYLCSVQACALAGLFFPHAGSQD